MKNIDARIKAPSRESRRLSVRIRTAPFATLALLATPFLLATAQGCTPAKSPSALEAKETIDLEPLESLLIGNYASAKKEALAYRGTNPVKEFARALVLETTGEREAAIESYLSALERLQDAARTLRSAKLAWMAASRLSALTEDLGGFNDSFQKRIGALANAPGNLGYRAHTHLSAFVTRLSDRGEIGENTDNKVRERFGCVTDLVLAGPFGHGARTDVIRSFPPERAAGPWPFRWDPDPLRNDTPRVLTTDTRRCFVSAKESPRAGIFYAQTFVTIPPGEETQDLVVYMRSAYGLTVDDHPIFSERQPVDAVHLRLLPGRHRLVVRLGEDKAVLRLLTPSGLPAKVATDANDTRGYQRAAPQVVSVGTKQTPGAPDAHGGSTPAERFLDMYNVSTLPMRGNEASFLAEELVARKGASPLALSFSCAPLRLDETTTSELQKERERTLHTRVLKEDPSFWYSTVWLALDASEKLGPAEFIRELENAAARFRSEPEVGASLARAYHRQSWRKEAIDALEQLTSRFPRFVPGWSFYLSVLDAIGPREKAESVARTLQDLDPNSTVAFERALLARDYPKAEAALRLREKRRPEDETRNEAMLLELLTKAGRTTELRAALSRVLRRKPDNVKQRFELADEAWALGQRSALREQATELALLGASNRSLREARSLLEGFTELESYRVDTQSTIAAFEAWERRGKKMSGSVARVLDYSALWIHPDGSSDMLEHEIQKIQSQEAIQNESEQRYPEGLVLRFRVLKKDGRALEPEWVEGKPTLTMPHLEVGDYIEFEHIVAYENDGSRGRTYSGPRWFFREQDKGYWRSEFVAVAPTKPGLDIEVVGNVPKPKERVLNAQFLERRWRVDESPAAPIEPDSVSPIETLPSVRLAWGLNLRTRLERMLDVASDRPPVDPRVHAIAKEIVGSTPPSDLLRRAELAYRYVNEKIQDGNESDGRRSLRAKSGSRMAAFVELLRALDIPYEYVAARNPMAPDLGSAMSAADQYDGFLLKLSTKRTGSGLADAAGDVWMSMRDKHTPFGYVPAEYRGSEAVRLVEGLPATTVPDVGRKDAISILGKIDFSLGASESARFSLAIAYDGSYDISMRSILDQLPAQKRNDFFESRILSRYFPSARIDTLEFDHLGDRSKSITVRLTGTATNLLRNEGNAAQLSPIFALHLSRMATLPKRETPLLVGSSSSVHIELSIVPPLGHTIEAPMDLRLNDKKLTYAESLKTTTGGILLTRDAILPATRISPAAYPEFSKFVRDADASMDRDIRFVKRAP